MRGTVLAGISAAVFGVTAFASGAVGGARAEEPSAAEQQKTPACYGAAARDPERPCRNPALRLMVRPAPPDAPMDQPEPCETTEFTALWGVCVIGAKQDEATSFMALVGDSHAAQLRPAINAIGVKRGMHVSTIWRAGCPFTTAPPDFDRKRSQDCVTWSKHVVSWLKDRPEIHTVVLAAHARARIAGRRGEKAPYEAKVAAYAAAMRSLPASVTNVIVVRDPPDNPRPATKCVGEAFANREPAGQRCRTLREDVLYDDAQADAALLVQSPAVNVVDLTPFMCGRTYCVPVVGGVLVHKDGDHLSTEFARTLAPYLDRAIKRIKPAVDGFR